MIYLTFCKNVGLGVYVEDQPFQFFLPFSLCAFPFCDLLMISVIDDLHMLYSIDTPIVQHFHSPGVPNDRPFSLLGMYQSAIT